MLLWFNAWLFCVSLCLLFWRSVHIARILPDHCLLLLFFSWMFLLTCSLFGFLSLAFLIVWISTIYSCVVSSARLGFVYLFLYPSRFIRNADCRQLFWYLFVFVLFVTNWEPRVLCWDFLFSCACVMGWCASMSILSVTATHCWSM